MSRSQTSQNCSDKPQTPLGRSTTEPQTPLGRSTTEPQTPLQRLTITWLSIWPFVIVTVAGVLIGFTASNWDAWTMLTKLVACETALLSFHVLEEWYFPGGFFWGYNTMQGSDMPDRYPLNRLSDMWTNSTGIACGCIFVLIGVTPMLAVMQFLLCVGELAAHVAGGVFMLNRLRFQGKRTIYNPGLATALVGYFPLAVCYLVFFVCVKAPSFLEVAGGIIGFIILAMIAIVAPEQICKSKDTPYAFPWGKGYFEKFA